MFFTHGIGWVFLDLTFQDLQPFKVTILTLQLLLHESLVIPYYHVSLPSILHKEHILSKREMLLSISLYPQRKPITLLQMFSQCMEAMMKTTSLNK